MEYLKCNCCGKKIKTEREIQKEDVLEIRKDWGYFSGKDGERHCFLVCEACYDKWIADFVVPPAVEERTEFL